VNTAVAFLHVATRLAKCALRDRLLGVLATIVGHFVGKRYHQLSSELSLSQAIILMKVAANNPRRTVQQIEIELSKAYLYRALRCKDSDSDSIYCLANVYLAGLCYTSEQYQTAIDHCTLAMKSQGHSQCRSHVVEGAVLPKIDDDIDTVLGLAVFYQYVRTTALNQKQTQYVSVFTTELLAQYLYIRCQSVVSGFQFIQLPSTDEVQRHSRYIIDMDQLFITDVLLLKEAIKMSSELTCRYTCARYKFSYYYYYYKPLSEQCQKSTNATELDTSELVKLLQQSAVEHLTTYRELQAREFCTVATVVTSDFEALYAYKRGDYQRCLQLSTQNVRTLLDASRMPVVRTFPEFIQLMDDDIASLIALVLTVDPKHLNNRVRQLTLSLYLMAQCQLKLRHSVTSQTLDYIEVVQRRTPVHDTLDHLILKMTTRKIMNCLTEKHLSL